MMSRAELIEAAIIILCILLWWPRLFWGFNPLWYHLLIYYGIPVALLIIFFRRFARMRAGLQESEDAIKKRPLTPPRQ